MKKIIVRGVLAVVVLAGCMGVIAAEASSSEQAAPGTGPFSRPMLMGVHRGGAAEWPENTVVAFREVARAFPDVLLEGDLQLSKDGAVVLLHDKTVDRTTNGTGAVKDLTLAELKALDAGYQFTTDGGVTYPWRGKGVTIPTFEEVLEIMPTQRALFELKDGVGLVAKVVPLIQAHNATERIIIASFQGALMKEMRTQLPEIATCFDREGALALFMALRVGDWDAYVPTDRMLSLPKGYVKQFAITGEEIQQLQQKGILVQVHTLNTEAEMDHYIALGVDSILSDYPSRLAARIAAKD